MRADRRLRSAGVRGDRGLGTPCSRRRSAGVGSPRTASVDGVAVMAEVAVAAAGVRGRDAPG